MITIYHNPRCSKSRESIAFMEEQGVAYKIIKYLDADLTENDVKTILTKLNYNPIDLVRTKDAFWKDTFGSNTLSDDEIIEAMVLNPKLIERPIVVNGPKAVIARPTEKIHEIL
ncbi:arsenate reductase (glutaredoxin) [Myroides odoratimimus]|uniref:Arsenate reductase n=4 Tax=Myroides TaxID=76831 RepID=A0A0U3G802_9FLAO|nr:MULTISPECIES: arsenate reductase (glutaredoxin) [Myroides]AJA67491.1 arsenate reductase (glutaredoxin) [Myroides sp. A21]ALU24776.1 arsenate reductase [Myroides odoratimimus]APA90821.1 arsenate reductase (glutaredoxin) [Myroides sp. ZB35]EHO07206.1 arsenate reductase (glutaredoxin) [Myroides odoratimimus CIP 101113]EHO09140.1 arsenate reductase (glutaredoxin) [Myroides odoratimimus CCUG 10230]